MSQRGVMLKGVLLAEGIPPKVVATKSGVHESTLSRLCNGVKDVSEEQWFRITFAVAEERARRKMRVVV